MTTNALYDLCDILQMPLATDGKAIDGQEERVLRFGDLKVTCRLRVLSSVLEDSGAGVLVRVLRDLGLFLSKQPGQHGLELTVLDLLALPEGGANYLEKQNAESVTAARALLRPRGKATFVRSGLVQPWVQATLGEPPANVAA